MVGRLSCVCLTLFNTAVDCTDSWSSSTVGESLSSPETPLLCFFSVSVAFPKVEQHNLTFTIKFRNSACGPRCWCLQIMCNTVLLWWWRNTTQMATNMGLTMPVEISSKLDDYIIAVILWIIDFWVEVSLFHFDKTNPQHPLVPSWTSV